MEQQRSPEWFKKRNGKITGSSIGAILGLSPFASPDDVMRRMVRQYHGAPSEFEGNAATEYGTFHEEYAIADLQLEYGVKLIETGFHIHPEIEWLGASPDGFIDGAAVAEIKCPFSKRDDKEPEYKTAKEQPHYYSQMQYEMFCTGRTECYFYQWNTHKGKLEIVAFDPRFIEETLPKLQEFYDKCLEEREPPFCHPHLEELIRTIPESLVAEEYKLAKADMEEAKKKMEAAKKQLIKLADGKKSNIGGLLVYPTERKGSIKYAQIVKDKLPDLDLTEYMGEASTSWTVK